MATGAPPASASSSPRTRSRAPCGRVLAYTRGMAGGPPQAFVERHPVPQRASRAQRAGDVPDRHRGRPPLPVFEAVDGAASRLSHFSRC